MSKEISSVFIIPRGSTEWKGNEAGWITASGWAAAADELWGNAVVTTTDGIFKPQDSRMFPLNPEGKPEQSSNNFKNFFRKFFPEMIITAFKDWKLKQSKPDVWPIERDEFIKKKSLKMIWQRHDLFSGPGRRLADKYNVPLVTSIEALAVWEGEKWGVKRPFWGNWLEKKFEAKALKESDLICCVSNELKEKVLMLGVDPKKVIVTPNRVDSTLFNPQVDGEKVYKDYNLAGKRVIGWMGSFRNFHGIDHIIEAFNLIEGQYPNVVLMLIGDGHQMNEIKELIRSRQLEERVILPGKQNFTDIPAFVSNFEIAIVSARSAEGFHYSPLKLREYKALGKAVIAPRAGELPRLFKDRKDLLLYDTGNIKNLADKIKELLSDKELAAELEKNSREWFKKEGAWVHELKKVCDILKVNY